MNTFSSMDWSPYTVNTAAKSHESILKEAEAEFKRKGNFVLLFPSALAPVNLYKNLFINHANANQDSLNWLLYNRFKERGIFS
jgi:hypothetical protein